MNRFATGLITGGVIGVVGVGLMLSDTKSRKKMVRGSKKAVRRANDMIENVADMF